MVRKYISKTRETGIWRCHKLILNLHALFVIKLTKEHILLLHSELIKMTGGSDGVRDIALLESALESPFQSYAGKELYPSIQAKALRLCYG